MKRKLLILLLPLIALAACSHKPEAVPLYSKYAARQDLTVAQVNGFQLRDTVKTDVVIIVADDTVAWSKLKEEMDIRASEGVTSWLGDINEPQRRTTIDSMPLWRVMTVHDQLTIAFYRIDNETQYDALLDYQLDNLENQ